ncbi:MAG: DUF3276 family protein [Bacteroidales bacterium]
MYLEDYNSKESQREREDELFSKPVRAGKRTYFFDVKATKNNDFYLTITESKRRVTADGQHHSYDKHKIFLYKEDFKKFRQGLEESIQFIKENIPDFEEQIRKSESYTNVDFDEL